MAMQPKRLDKKQSLSIVFLLFFVYIGLCFIEWPRYWFSIYREMDSLPIIRDFPNKVMRNGVGVIFGFTLFSSIIGLIYGQKSVAVFFSAVNLLLSILATYWMLPTSSHILEILPEIGNIIYLIACIILLVYSLTGKGGKTFSVITLAMGIVCIASTLALTLFSSQGFVGSLYYERYGLLNTLLGCSDITGKTSYGYSLIGLLPFSRAITYFILYIGFSASSVYEYTEHVKPVVINHVNEMQNTKGIDDTVQSFHVNPTEIEYRYRCKVCGKVFCYTEAERRESENRKKEAGFENLMAGLNHLAGSRYAAFEMSKAANAAESKTIDYSKCPNCNSSDIVRIDGNTSSVVKKEEDSVSTLEKLAKLHDQGIITDEEFQQKKSEILAKM